MQLTCLELSFRRLISFALVSISDLLLQTTPLFIYFRTSHFSHFLDNISPMKYGINTKINFLRVGRLQNNTACFFIRNTFLSNTRLRFNNLRYQEKEKYTKALLSKEHYGYKIHVYIHRGAA